MVQMILDKVQRYCGARPHVEIRGTVVSLIAKSDGWRGETSYDIVNLHEVHGRLHHWNLTHEDMVNIFVACHT